MFKYDLVGKLSNIETGSWRRSRQWANEIAHTIFIKSIYKISETYDLELVFLRDCMI